LKKIHRQNPLKDASKAGVPFLLKTGHQAKACIFALGFGLLCLLSACDTEFTDKPTTIDSTPDLQALRPAINNALHRMHVPGIAVAVVNEQGPLLIEGYGLRQVDQQKLVDADTLFPIASTSKAFTALALATLVDKEKLKWDDPLTNHLPGLEFNDSYLTKHVTLRDVLAHRVGLVRADPGWLANPGWSREQLLSRVRYIPSLDGFRQGWHYSNWMYTAAGEVIPALTGKSWDEYLDKVIFKPLDMQNTSTRFSMLQNTSNVTVGHVLVDDNIVDVPLRNIEVIGPAGSINSTATDMSKWCGLLLGKGSVGEQTIVEEHTFAELMQPQVVINAPPEAATLGGGFHHLAYTLGWGRMDYQGKETMYWHNGGIDGIATQVALLPESGICIAILANRSRADALNDAVRNTILDLLLSREAEKTDWFARAYEQYKSASALVTENEDQPQESDTPKHAALNIDAFTGTYEHPIYGHAIIAQTGERQLKVVFGSALEARLLRHEDGNFETLSELSDERAPGQLSQFLVDTEGQITGFKVSFSDSGADVVTYQRTNSATVLE